MKKMFLLLIPLALLVACADEPTRTPVPAATSAPVQSTQPPAPATTAPVATVAAPAATATTVALPTAPTAPSAPTAQAGFVQLGDSLNRDKTQAASDYKLEMGSLEAGKQVVAWVTWAEKQGSSQQIFVSKQNGNKFEPAGGSLNIHSNLVAEAPSIDFAGTDRTVPWVAWYEPSPRSGASQKQVFASRFNATSGLWIPAGQDRGGNEPSLNIHTNKLAQDPNLVGGTTDPTKSPSPWVCWQEVSANNNAVEIFVSHAVSDTTALGGFKWQPVGLNRSGTAADPEPSVNLDVTGGSNSDHCRIVFAETSNSVPWVVWAEKLRTSPTQIFVARAVADSTAGAGGFKWQFVPNCTPQDASKCALNVNPTKDAFEPAMAAGTVIAGQATVPWIAWSEVGANGKRQIFVNRLDQVSRNAFLNVGGSLNVDQTHDAHAPDITFVGNIPFVSWDEEVGTTRRVFVRHLASDPQTGTWVLDTPKEGLAVDKTKLATGPDIRATSGGKIVLAYVQGDPDKEASQIIVCTNGPLVSLLQRIPGLAAPLLQARGC
jgi:hypothetical protein